MKKLLLICLLMAGVFASAQTTGGYQIGDVAKDFSLKNTDGKEVSLASYQDAKGFIIVFTCNTCPVAKAYEKRIMDLSASYQKLGYPLIAINPNDPDVQPGESYEKMQERAKEKGYAFPYLSDPGHVVTRQFGATRTPHIFVLQKTSKGNVVSYIGAIDDDTEEANPSRKKFVEEAINSLAAGQKPATPVTKAVGCTIKWKKS